MVGFATDLFGRLIKGRSGVAEEFQDFLDHRIVPLIVSGGLGVVRALKAEAIDWFYQVSLSAKIADLGMLEPFINAGKHP